MTRPPPTSTLFPYTTLFRSQQEANRAGEALYKQRCAACHEGAAPRAPNRARLQQMSPENVRLALLGGDRKSTRLNSSHVEISYAVFCLKKKKSKEIRN